MSLALGVFVTSFLVTLYIFAGYPALLYVTSRVRPRPVRRAGGSPPVTLVIPVHNEEAIIDAKVQNALALTYPEDRLEILIVSDGSTDRTEAIVERYIFSNRYSVLRGFSPTTSGASLASTICRVTSGHSPALPSPMTPVSVSTSTTNQLKNRKGAWASL